MSRKIIKNLKKISELEQIGRPDADWKVQERSVLLSQINPSGKTAETSLLSYYLQFFLQSLKGYVLRPALMAMLVFGAYFGYSAVTLAAMASLPGDSLYPIKVLTEKVQMVATISEENKVKLKAEFISRRGEELKQIAKLPEDDKTKAVRIALAVKNITTEVKKVNESMEKIAVSRSASSVISMARIVDEQTLKIEKDLVEANTSLSAEVKKEVAEDVKEAIEKTGETGSRALTIIVDKSSEKDVKDTPVSAPDKELTDRIAQRIESTEEAVLVLGVEIGKIISSTIPEVMDKDVIVAFDGKEEIIKISEALKRISSKPNEAKILIREAKDYLDKKEFNLALGRVDQGRNIISGVINNTPIIDKTIKIRIESIMTAVNLTTDIDNISVSTNTSNINNVNEDSNLTTSTQD